MSTLEEIETAVRGLGPKELTHLEPIVRAARLQHERQSCPKALELPPLNLGALLQPLSDDDDLLEEMIDETLA